MSAWPVMMPSRVRSATTAARAATAAAVGEGRPVERLGRAGGPAGRWRRRSGPALDRRPPGQADQRERQPWTDQLVAPWRQALTATAAIQVSPTSGPVTSRPSATRRACTAQAPARTRRRLVRVAELGDRRRSPRGEHPAPGGSRGLPEPVAQLIGDRGRADGGPGAGRRPPPGSRATVRSRLPGAAQVAAGHGLSPSRAVTAAENSCQEDRSSLRVRRPAAVRA